MHVHLFWFVVCLQPGLSGFGITPKEGQHTLLLFFFGKKGGIL